MSTQNQLVGGNWNQRNDELFDNQLNNWMVPGEMVGNRANQLMRNTKQELAPFAPILGADLVETPNEFHVQSDLPGVLAEDLDVSIYGRNLVLSFIYSFLLTYITHSPFDPLFITELINLLLSIDY